MKALIDNAYLHSVSRCIKHNAKQETDLNNFYRFIGEIISHRTILITARKGGTVYKNTIENINILKELGNSKKVVKFFNQEKINYNKITEKVAINLQFMDIPTLVYSIQSDDLIPNFYGDNPDINFHNWLIGKEKEIDISYLEKYGSIYLPIIVIKKANLWEKINHFIYKTPNWKIENSLAFASKIRSWVYNELSNSINAAYIPSISRGINIKLKFSSPSLRKLLFNDNTLYSDFENHLNSNTNIITSILERNNADPVETIKDAFYIRKKIKDLRNYLYKKPMLKNGDALLVYQYEKLEELEKIKQEYIENGKMFFPYDSFNPVLSISSINQKIEVELPLISGAIKTILYFRKKRLLNKMKPLLLPILQTKFSENDNLFNNFKIKCGL